MSINNSKIVIYGTAISEDEDEDKDIDEDGVTTEEFSRELRHNGQVALILSHSSMQIAWK